MTFKDRFLVLTTIIFAVALQIQASFFTSGDYLGLRLNLADLLLPFVGAFIVGSLLLGKSEWPSWQKPFGYWAPVLLSLLVALACLNGFLIQGEWSKWAVVNKFAGWFVLMGYLGAGAWLVRNARQNLRLIFALSFTTFFFIAGLFSITHHYIFWEIDRSLVPHPGAYLAGLMGNRNAFGFSLMAAVLLAIEFLPRQTPSTALQKTLHWGFWLLVFACAVAIGSRALYLCLFGIVIVFLFRQRRYFLRFVLPVCAVGVLLVPFMYHNFMYRIVMPVYQMAVLFEQAENMPDYSKHYQIVKDYDLPRLTIIKDSLDLIREHPLTGAGLGSMMSHQHTAYGKNLAVIDNSLLWVLVEMGPIGLFGFVWVYLVILRALYTKEDEPFLRAVFWLMLVFGIFSLFHEILYTRFLWFMLGLALAVPKVRQAEQVSSGRRVFRHQRYRQNRGFGRRRSL